MASSLPGENVARHSYRQLVSIVLPTYNGSRFIGSTIESVIAQTYTNWELLVVDDCSTDNVMAIVERYAALDNRIRLIRHECNRKLPASLNSGFAQSRGEYLTWISDDNYFHPDAISEMVGYLRRNPAVDMVYTDYEVVDESNRSVETIAVLPPEQLLRKNCVGASFLYKRSVMEAIGNYSGDSYMAEDYDYWLRCFCEFRMEPYHKVLYYYRRHRSSLSCRHIRNVKRVANLVLLRHIHRVKGISADHKAEALIRVARRLAMQRDLRLAGRHAWMALTISPWATCKYCISWLLHKIPVC